jgi:hypothetical protein
MRRIRPFLVRRASARSVFCWPIIGLVCLAACRAGDKAADSAVTRTKAVDDSEASYGLKLLRGPGFVLSVPDEAIVERKTDTTGKPSWEVHAPSQSITASIGTADTTRFTDDRPLYSFTVSLRQKPTAQTLKAWGDSIVAADEATADELSKGEHGALQTVAGTTAYLRHPTCGDCGVDIVTFANRGQLVEIQYSTDTAEPLGVRKRGIYALILATFRWTSTTIP